MKITKNQLRRIIKEELLREQAAISPDQFREDIEWGEWPGRPHSFEWDYVESEGPSDVRFDWDGGSMWFRAWGGHDGEVEGNIPDHLVPHLEKMGLEVYAE